MFRGYDIISESNIEQRHIEVKSFKTSGPIELTIHEWIVSEKMGQNYWLYTVENALDDDTFIITEICDPHSVFKDSAEQVQFMSFKFLIQNWKEKLAQESNNGIRNLQ
jgi:hypothetical protein